ncbi:IclR family transcriptional regulator C-terminal domain-containing protein [Streptomyces sp. NPDC048504]|uniref:IclR family transcriptional regulator domain-containing protein n=1 Tax=Streptomyces sp. NPDC048504 TaxID=3365559 RepID=UPI003715154A
MTVDEELEKGLRSIAVPVRDRAGRAAAALNVATHATRHTVASEMEWPQQLSSTESLTQTFLPVRGVFPVPHGRPMRCGRYSTFEKERKTQKEHRRKHRKSTGSVVFTSE